MRSLWERVSPRGQCGKSVLWGMAIGLALSLAVIAALALRLL